MKSELKLMLFTVVTAIAYNTLGMKDDHNDLSNKTATTVVDAYWSSEEKDAKLDKIWEYYNHWYTKLPKDAPCFGWVAPEGYDILAYEGFINILNRACDKRGVDSVFEDYGKRAECFADTGFMTYLVENRIFVKVTSRSGEYILCPAGLWTRENFRSFYQNYKSKAKLK